MGYYHKAYVYSTYTYGECYVILDIDSESSHTLFYGPVEMSSLILSSQYQWVGPGPVIPRDAIGITRAEFRLQGRAIDEPAITDYADSNVRANGHIQVYSSTHNPTTEAAESLAYATAYTDSNNWRFGGGVAANFSPSPGVSISLSYTQGGGNDVYLQMGPASKTVSKMGCTGTYSITGTLDDVWVNVTVKGRNAWSESYGGQGFSF